MRRAVFALVVALVAAGCLGKPPQAPPAVDPDADAAAVRFVVVGDTGTGDAAEYRVAASIGRTCAERGCDFLVHTGDILYDVGAFSAYDAQFEDKFERPYGSLGLPVYLVLGNHDVGSDPHSEEDLGRWKEVGDRAVEYSHRTDRTTDTWRMPARWYAFTQGPLAFAAFDTSAFLYVPLESDPRGPLHQAVTAQETFAATAWPANATWRFAVAHHPYISNGQHGDAADHADGRIHGRILDWFYETHVCPQVDLLLTGHDHDLQLLAPAASCGTRFLVSGAGAKTRPLADPDRNPALFQRGDALGFWWLEARGQDLRMVALDGDGKALFEAAITKPPASSPSPTTGPAAPG